MSIPTNHSIIFPNHHQISPTIFLCVPNHHTTSDNQSHSNREIIDIEDEEEKVENTCKNGSSIDDSSDEEEIEVIQLSDDDDEVNDESNNLKLDKHKFNHIFTNEPLKLTYKTMLQKQHPTDFGYSSVPSTSQTEHQPLLCPHEENDDNIDGSVFHGQVTKTLGLTCSECSKLIHNWSKLEKHLMKKHGKISFKCMVRGCNEQFVKRTLLNKHYTIHCSNRAKLACSTVDCHYEASNQKSFVNHLYKYHEKGLFQCVHCLEPISILGLG